MLFTDLLQETYYSLKSNKSRSALTILGIVIGIASVIAMISIGQGAAKNIEDNIKSLGSNLLIITPGSQQGPGSIVRGGGGSVTTLTLADAEAIKSSIEEINSVSPEVNAREQIAARGSNNNTSIYGINEDYFSTNNLVIASGQAITVTHEKNLSKVAVIGPNVQTDLFGEGTTALSQKIKIKNQQYTIIGITESKGGSNFGSPDDLVYIPLSTAQQYLTGSNSLSKINVQVSKEKYMASVQEQINSLLLARHNIRTSTEADFSIVNQSEIIDTMSSVTQTMTLLLGAIAGISLLVGGIGIMNMMLTTVTERIKEIGLRKSLGARKEDISNQFLYESITLTLISGVIGVILGWSISVAINKFSSMTTSLTLTPVLLAFGVSAAIGIIFGYYPAKRAARLNPIDALRYE